MKSKTMILLGVAGVCGLVASYMTSRFLADQNEKVAVLVAKQRVPSGTHIKKPDDLFELDERPRNEVPKNSVMKGLDAVTDQILMKTLDKGEVVVADYLKNKDQVGLEVVLPPGKRAVAVRTTQESVVGGFVLPGSHVDIIHSMRTGEREPSSRVILQNILVRAVNQLDKRPETGGVVPATVTLEVSPEEALVLARVKDVGSITLSLRPVNDDSLIAADTPPQTAPPPPPPPPPQPTPEAKTEVAAQPENELKPEGTSEPRPEMKPVPRDEDAKPEPKPEVAAKPEPKPESKPVVAEKPPEPKVDKKTLLIQNGHHWIRATFVTPENGETQTTFERSQTGN